ncbi:MAG: fructose-6-phosphate aldolase [Campylobacteraceae bacterium]|nr:fructose-6-phosphate aldolase [Campylobacteraceae bacterium]
MEIFLDTANIDEIKRFASIGIINGVTTNPALIAKEGKNFRDVVNEICSIIDGPVSAEVISKDFKNMIEEARKISKIHKNIVVKIPATEDGYKALSIVAKEGIKTNFTIVYTANQALLAAKLGATYVSPFIGRLDANSTSGNNLIQEMATIYKNYNFNTKILAASMRNVIYVKEAALAGAHTATIPPDVLAQMMNNELTNVALDGFLKLWYELDESKREYFN